MIQPISDKMLTIKDGLMEISYVIYEEIKPKNKVIKDITLEFNKKINAYQILINTEGIYCHIDDNTSSLNKLYIYIQPHIYENEKDLHEYEFEKYFDHSDYFNIQIEIDLPFKSAYCSTTSLKHQYLITIFNSEDYFK